MDNNQEEHHKRRLRVIPPMEALLGEIEAGGVSGGYSRELLKDACRRVLDGWRLRLQALGEAIPEDLTRAVILREASREVVRIMEELDNGSLRGVVNATGVIVHTNLGRAPLSDEAVARVVAVARGYSNLEYNLSLGVRGERNDHLRDLLRVLTGAEDALVVNNNAAALLLSLNTVAESREVIVSRGELIEIGDSFRIPEIMAKSGARLREVGTTNRTRPSDYARALTPETAAILKIHTSNYRIVGFSEEASLDDLVALGRKNRCLVISDPGSGLLVDLRPFGIQDEPVVPALIARGADLVTFSGDKLLGGPQAGIICGRSELIAAIGKNPLARAFRIDKLTLAALEATLKQYLDPAVALEKIPVLKALTEPVSTVKRRMGRLTRMLRKAGPAGLNFSLEDGHALAGGGSLPLRGLKTALLAVRHRCFSTSELERRLRQQGVVGRISEDRLLLDGRTIADGELSLVCRALAAICSEAGKTSHE